MGVTDEGFPSGGVAKAVIFVGAFLLFMVEPMVGRALLPLFGGTATVWVTCLATFQVLLLAGYFYAHVIAYKCKAMYKIHVGLLVLAVTWVIYLIARYPSCLPIPTGQNIAHLLASVIIAVLVMIGGPYVLLSANSSLVQVLADRQRVQTNRAGDVYHLYAVSNAGALIGLLCYPFLVEPFFSLNTQWYGFALLTLIYTGLFYVCARLSNAGVGCTQKMGDTCSDYDESDGGEPLTGQTSWCWLVIPGLSCFLLNAITAYLTTDLTPMPLVWVILLALFLLSYIIGFSRFGERGVPVFGGLMLIFIGVCAILLPQRNGNVFFLVLWPALGLLLFGGLFLHGWLYRLRPANAALTKFYLYMALGGTIGGSFSGLLAPVLFSSVMEYPLILALLLLMNMLYLWKEREWLDKTVVRYSFFGVGLAFLFIAHSMIADKENHPILRVRSFYGMLTVFQAESKSMLGESIPLKTFNHGNTIHGIQFGPHYLRDKPTGYYTETGGGIGITSHPSYTNGSPMRVGLVGMGIGTLACWGRTNDLYRFYEIDENVIRIATNSSYFTFIRDSAARVEIVTGDARFELKKECEQQQEKYDVLVLDAFTGDSVPYHLLTREAFELYFERLKPDGVLAIHCSSWHINLAPICKAVGRKFEKKCVGSVSNPEGVAVLAAIWSFISQQPINLSNKRVSEIDWDRVQNITLPADEKGSLMSLIRPNFTLPLKETNFTNLRISDLLKNKK